MAKTHYCYLKKFNNYFNRKIIRFDTLEEYQSASEDYEIPLNDKGQTALFDFNPNDNVTTEIIGNDLSFDPDYFLVLDTDLNILSRWFVIEQKRNRQGQWLYQLKRDVISDNVEKLMTAPVFVQKGIVGDENPLILNSEGMNFNQIKTEETLLKDDTKTSWLIGYIAKSAGGADINIQIPTEDIEGAVTLSQIALDLGTTEAILSGLLNFDGINAYPTRFVNKLSLAFSVEGGIVDNQLASWYNTKNHLFQKSARQGYITYNPQHPLYSGTLTNIGTRFENALTTYTNATALNNQMPTIMGTSYYFTTDIEYIKLKAYEGKYVHYLGKYYKFHIVESGTSTITHDTNFVYTKYSSLQQIAIDATYQATLNAGGRFDYIETQAKKIYIQMQEITDDATIPQAETKISTNRRVTLDQQFDMICLPAGPFTMYYDNGTYNIPFESNPDIARRIINELAVQEDAKVYDIQLLPYCPISSLLSSRLLSGTEGEDFDYITVGSTQLSLIIHVDEITYPSSPVVTDLGGGNYQVVVYFVCQTQTDKTCAIDNFEVFSKEGADITTDSITINVGTGLGIAQYTVTDPNPAHSPLNAYISLSYHYAGTSKVGAIFYCNQTSFQTILDYKLELKDSMKIDSQCDMYRLLSPNYQGTFEFNVAKNGGTVDFFTAYCTYKPYTPFIKVCPAFSFVYGMDYNDNRGLICGGDFSLPRINSAWQSYQLNNKNYQNIFNREIQNLDIMQGLEARQQYIAGGIGIGTDSMKGAVSGALVGGGWGALAGGIIGAGMSSVGYGIDIDIMAKQHQEARSLAVDKYNYQLGNIKALPYTLTKVGAFDISSKIFPVLEYYTCSEEEKQALRNKIKYESMTIMAIGLFGDYYRAFDELKYFKGELIRNDEIADDSHILDAIYAELLKGVYM